MATGGTFGDNEVENFCTDAMSVLSPTGVALEDLRLFPNPALDRVRIEGFAAVQGTWSVKDVLGREAAAGLWQGVPLDLEVGRWPQGTYFFEVQGQTGERQVLRFAVVN